MVVKCLAEGSTEKERIKFLQEAAIMGQFKYPNILTIFGIVTTLELVRIFVVAACCKVLSYQVQGKLTSSYNEWYRTWT